MIHLTNTYLTLDQWEAQKNRFRKHSQQGMELAVSLDRNVHLRDGDVLIWDEIKRAAIVVRIELKDVLVIQLNQLLATSAEQIQRTPIVGKERLSVIAPCYHLEFCRSSPGRRADGVFLS